MTTLPSMPARALVAPAFLTLFAFAAPARAGADASAAPALGLYPLSEFRLSDGRCADCGALPQAMWYFEREAVAVPLRNPDAFDPEAGYRDDAARVLDDTAAAASRPPLVWLGGAAAVPRARLSADGALNADGKPLAWRLAPRLESNRSWYDDTTAAFLRQRELSVRADAAPDGTLSVRSFWPRDFALPAVAAAQPLRADESLQQLVRAEHGGARGAFQTRVLWERRPGTRWHPGQAVLGLMLNGAQGDDDEAHGGHFAVFTGRTRADGQMGDWLVNNFYNLDSVSEKGIVAAATPLDSYLAELNSGQSYYRPSYMLVAVLKDGRAAGLYQSAINRVLHHFYRHDFVYGHAKANCSGISIDTLRALGWNIGEHGPTDRLKALAAYYYVAATERSLSSGRKIYDYLNEERTRLYPAVAFDAAGADLLKLVEGKAGRALTPYEKLLSEDLEAIVWVRVPQIPSSRAAGQAPVYSFDEYMARTPADRGQWKIVPVGARDFPERWRSEANVGERPSGPVPLPVAIVTLLAVAGLGWAGLWLTRRLRSRRA